ncbi:MAG: hypothetical protein FJ009_15900 [Chloroflexi bacterium]|nr:hypothetical protein [Chloroflexota bacterium]
MATGRTVSASFLTERDARVVKLCGSISKQIADCIDDENNRKKFLNDFGKTSDTRDGGMGVGAGKLQRDALCTRGRQGKAPFSNRNLRWHPLVVAETCPNWAQPISRIEIENDELLVFVVKENGRSKKYRADKVHEMRQRYAALPACWVPHIDTLKIWNDTLWTQNSCVIPILEACDWQDAVETYAVLGIAIAVAFFGVDFSRVYAQVTQTLEQQKIASQVSLPSPNFPSDRTEIINCPVCRVSIAKSAARLTERVRAKVWQPAWRSTKREEGEDSSIQLMHVKPLVESEPRHHVGNVRYGHRWCNVAMTDHSLDETLDFMESIVRAHNRCK